METKPVFVGLDLSDVNVSLARFDRATGSARVPVPDDRGRMPFRVACRELRSGGRRDVEAIFPAPDTWQEDAGWLLFRDVRTNLPTYRDQRVQKFLTQPVFEFWRRAIPADEAHVSIAVPLEYSRETCDALREAAHEAKFASCACVQEPLAALLACVCERHASPKRWTVLEGGQCVWVLESGYLDLNVALMYVHCRKDKETEWFDVAYLGGDRLEHLGSAWSLDLPRLQAGVREAHSHLVDAAFGQVWPDWPNDDPLPARERANWLICSGEGPSLQPAVEVFSALLSTPTLMNDRLAPGDAVARGAAVHAAIQARQLPYRIRTRIRWLLGLRVKTDGTKTFSEMTDARDEPPFDFERAFEVEGPVRTPVEVTLAAALPGGDRCESLRTFVFESSTFAGDDRPVLLVSGRLENWAGGTVQVHDARSGTRLAEGKFFLS